MKTTTPLPLSSPAAAFSNGSGSEISDADLMCALQHQDATALELLYRKYRDLFRAVIVRIVHDQAAADDVLQECLVEIWRSASRFSSVKGEPLGWLVTLCKRRAIDSVRRNKSYCSACDRLEAEVKMQPVNPGDNHDCENADLAHLVREHLSQLPEAQRQAVYLAFMEGMSQREVARATQTPLGTVKTRLELGLQKLRASFRTRSAMHGLHAA